MKKILSLLTIALIAVQAWGFAAGDRFSDGNVSYRVVTTTMGENYPIAAVTGLSTTGAAQNDLALRIPTSIEHDGQRFQVDRIDEYAFKGKTNITTVTIDYGNTAIYKSSFEGCTNLKQVRIPSSCTYISANAFAGCTKLNLVIYTNEDLTDAYIHADAFPKNADMYLYLRWSGTKDVVNLFKKHAAFSHFKYISRSKSGYDFIYDTGACFSVTKAPTRLSYGEFTLTGFIDTNTRRSLVLNKSTYSVDGYTYKLVAIADSACYYQTPLTEVNLTGSRYLTTIGKSAFEKCTALETVTLNEGLETIEDNAFASCTSLNPEFYLPSTVKEIYRSFDRNTTAIKKFKVSSYNENLKDYNGALYCKETDGTYALKLWPRGGENSIAEKEFMPGMTALKNQCFYECPTIVVYLPYGVKSVESYSFAHCSQLMCVKIPSSVNYLGTNTFYNCPSLEKLYINLTTPPIIPSTMFANSKKINLYVPREAEEAYKSANYWKDWKQINYGRTAYDLETKDYKRDNGETSATFYTVTSNSSYGRYGTGKTYDGQVRLVMKETIYADTEVGGKLVVPESIKDEMGNEYAVTSIGPRVFANTHLIGSGDKCHTVTLGLNVETIMEDAFIYRDHITKLNLNPNLKRVENHAFEDCKIANDLMFSYGIKYLGASAFYGNPIKKMRIPSSATQLHSLFFDGLNQLEELVLNVDYDKMEDFKHSDYIWTIDGLKNKNTKVYVPTESVDKYKAQNYWKQVASNITAGGHDFTYNNGVPGNTAYYMTVTSNSIGDYEGDVSYGFAKYVYHPAVAAVSKGGKFGAADVEIDRSNGDYKRYRITEFGDNCLANANYTSVSTDKMKSLMRIGNSAFAGCPLTEFVIPENVNYIGSKAFNGCSALNTLTVKTKNPPTVNNADAFTTYKTTKLIVPQASVNTYKTTSIWKDFYSIQGEDSGLKGDVNGDGVVDISDVNILLNIVLGKDSASKYAGRADVTGDGNIDISDVNSCINIVLGKG
ncbi:leucine-rich repeat protein [Sodaliphilus sp.]|uniref:leucine-rich repeat protein n=1 Tax=Sodaliphilus sp. TaxID=2815818 RepID=UPI00388F9BB9